MALKDDGQANCWSDRVHMRAPVAAYRDMDGRPHEKSAVCTHLKCIVASAVEDRYAAAEAKGESVRPVAAREKRKSRPARS